MKIKRENKNKCVLCDNVVIEQCTEILLDPECVPDQGNCDFSEYTDYCIVGGYLLEQPFGVGYWGSKSVKAVCCECVESSDAVRTLVNIILGKR